MNNEIMKILDRLERIDHKEYSGGFEFADSGSFDEDCRCFEERKKMADYITNLQKENERLKEENKNPLRGIFAQVNDDQLLRSNALNYAELQDYKSRNENTIERIKSLIIFWKKFSPDNTMIIGQLENLLNILNGGDKE